MTTTQRPARLVLGVIGADVHIVGARVLEFALGEAGYDVTSLGVMVSQDEFIDAAIETGADAILVSSLYGHGEIDCRGFRDRCRERGIGDIILLVGGNLVVGRQDWGEVEAMFLSYGFDAACPPGTDVDAAIEILAKHLDRRRRVEESDA